MATEDETATPEDGDKNTDTDSSTKQGISVTGNTNMSIQGMSTITFTGSDLSVSGKDLSVSVVSNEVTVNGLKFSGLKFTGISVSA